MELIKEYWGLIVAFIAYVLWLGRLEGRANSNTRDLEKLEKRLEKQRNEDMASNKSYRDDVKATLNDIQQDIKQLLRRQRDE
jgi:hypothetical protein